MTEVVHQAGSAKRADVRTSICAALLAIASSTAPASAAQIPAPIIGTWAHGSCSVRANRLVITATTVALGVGKPAAAHFDADDGSAHGAIHWNQEYVVDNFEYVSQTGVIVHNTQGFHMPGQVTYKRCPT